jgi:hypothetical protein
MVLMYRVPNFPIGYVSSPYISPSHPLRGSVIKPTSGESTKLISAARFSSLDAAVTCGKFYEDAMEMVPGKTVAPENHRPLMESAIAMEGTCRRDALICSAQRSLVRSNRSVAQLPCCPYP